MARQRKPAALKVLDGNPGKRPIQAEPEPTGEVQKPPGIRGRAADIWEEYAPVLIDMGTLKSPDAHQFAVWCKLAAMSEKQFTRMSAGQITQMRLLAETFGMSATGRAKLGTTEKKKPENAFAKLA